MHSWEDGGNTEYVSGFQSNAIENCALISGLAKWEL